MNAIILLLISQAAGVNLSVGYVIGAVIALLVLGYLLYALIRPEKF